MIPASIETNTHYATLTTDHPADDRHRGLLARLTALLGLIPFPDSKFLEATKNVGL